MAKLSKDAMLVLAALPKEPLAHSAPDLAADLFGHADSHAVGRMNEALAELKEFTYIRFENTKGFGHKDQYGIRASMWIEAIRVVAKTQYRNSPRVARAGP